jgi:hypothetical protein
VATHLTGDQEALDAPHTYPTASLGYRVMRLTHDGGLASASRDVMWRHGDNTAYCGRGFLHHAPDADCECGWYAYHDLAHAVQHAETFGVHAVVVAMVAGRGETLIHHDGFRCACATILALAYLPSATDVTRRHAVAAAEAYDVDLYAVEDFNSLTVAGADPVPQGERPGPSDRIPGSVAPAPASGRSQSAQRVARVTDRIVCLGAGVVVVDLIVLLLLRFAADHFVLPHDASVTKIATVPGYSLAVAMIGAVSAHASSVAFPPIRRLVWSRPWFTVGAAIGLAVSACSLPASSWMTPMFVGFALIGALFTGGSYRSDPRQRYAVLCLSVAAFVAISIGFAPVPQDALRLTVARSGLYATLRAQLPTWRISKGISTSLRREPVTTNLEECLPGGSPDDCSIVATRRGVSNSTDSFRVAILSTTTRYLLDISYGTVSVDSAIVTI